MTVDTIYPLDQISAANRSLVGDKAFYLSLLQQHNYPVVPGIVISADVFRQFLETIHWLEPLFADLPTSSLHLDVDNPRQLQAIAHQLRQSIQATPLWDNWLNQLVAQIQLWQRPSIILRPSITLQSGLDPGLSQRTMGLLRSQACWVDRQAIAEALKTLWGELFCARSLLYWQRSGVQIQQVNLAVLVQPLESAIASGYLTINSNNLEIYSTWGLGNAVVQGEVIPDAYHVHPQTGSIQKQHLSRKIRAYRIAPTPFSSPQSGELASIAQTEPCLQVYSIELDQQQQASLNSSQLTQLIGLAQQAMTDLGTSLNLEWTIHKFSDQTSPVLHITQVNVLLLEGQASEEDVDAPDVLTPSTIHPNQSTPSLVLTGMAASKGQTLAKAWVIHELQSPANIPAGVILVAPIILPSWVSRFRSLAGIITNRGGMTSHGAIIARELGIPAVVAAGDATRQIQTGDVVFLDGNRGIIYLNSPDAALSQETALAKTGHTRTASPTTQDLSFLRSSTPLPRQPNVTQLLVNLSQLDTLEQVAALPVEGIGLLRSEMIIQDLLEQRSLRQWIEHPQDYTAALASLIQRVAEAFAPRPIFYRSLDLRSHEFLPEAEDIPIELNPILGIHGTFSYSLDPTLFGIELSALRQVQQSGFDNIRLILPFVRTVEEFVFCRQHVAQAGLFQDPSFQLWIMAEVPSILFLIPEYIEAGVQGISIGCNDLTQLLLGVDRDHPQMSSAFDPRQIAVQRAIQQIIQTTRKAGIPCSICGQAPSLYPEFIEPLVRWGITSISVSPDVVEQSYRAIVHSEDNLLKANYRFKNENF